MKTAIINGKEMTKEQLFDAVKNLRARDLIEKYLIPNGIKYNGSKTSLKESKQAVIDRMIKHFGLDEEETVEAVQQEVEEEFTDTEQEVKQDDDIPENPMSDEEHDLIEALKDFTEIYPDITSELLLLVRIMSLLPLLLLRLWDMIKLWIRLLRLSVNTDR